MKKIILYAPSAVLALASTVPLWFLLNNFQALSPALYSFAVLFVFGIIIGLKLFANNALAKIHNAFIKATAYKYFSLIAIASIALVAVAIRLYFYWRYAYAPVSDPVTFYSAAKGVASGHWLKGNSYPAFFPYLAAYDTILGFAMKVIKNTWLATILLNTLFDLFAAFITYVLAKKLSKPGSKLPILAFAFWLLSPFNILFSVLSLPIIIVNFFVIATVLIAHILHENITNNKTKTSLALAILFGVTIGIGNWFRPVFSIAILALLLLFIYTYLSQKSKRSLLYLLSSCFVIIAILYLGLQKLNLTIVANETGLQPASNDSGWSIYIGSNSSTNGMWNMADQNRMNQQICKNYKSLNDCQQKLEKAGIDRYKTYGVGGIISLFIRKLYVFSSGQSNVYNANYSITNYTNSVPQKLLSVYIILFITAIFYLSLRFMYYAAKLSRLKNKASPTVLFMALLLLGFFLSDMFVEAAERYAQIVYPLFIIISVLSLETFKKRSPKAT